MRTYRAVARNEKGDRFSFVFLADNWNGITANAEKELKNIINADKLHRSNGPFVVISIDVD